MLEKRKRKSDKSLESEIEFGRKSVVREGVRRGLLHV